MCIYYKYPAYEMMKHKHPKVLRDIFILTKNKVLHKQVKKTKLVPRHQDTLGSVCRMGRLVFGNIFLLEHFPSGKHQEVAVVGTCSLRHKIMESELILLLEKNHPIQIFNQLSHSFMIHRYACI